MIRTSVRRFATSARRAAETVAEMEAPSAHALRISHAQGIAENGLVSGASFSIKASYLHMILTSCSHWQNPFDPLKEDLRAHWL